MRKLEDGYTDGRFDSWYDDWREDSEDEDEDFKEIKAQRMSIVVAMCIILQHRDPSPKESFGQNIPPFTHRFDTALSIFFKQNK